MSRFIALLIGLIPLVASAKEPDAESLAREVAPYLDDQTLAVIHVDLTRIDFEPALKQLEKLDTPKRQVEEMRRTLKALLDSLKGAGLKRGFAVVSLADLPDPPLVVLPLDEDARANPAAKLLAELVGYSTWEKDGVLVAGKERAIKRIRNLKPVARPDLVRAFADAPSSAAHGVIMPNDDLRRALAELIPTLPRELGGGSSAAVTRGVRWLSLSANVAPAATFSMTVQASDESSAKALRELWAAIFKAAGSDKEVRAALPDYDTLAAILLPKVAGDRLELIVKEEQVVSLLAPALARLHEAAQQSVQMNNLKQIGVAFHASLDANRTFPAYASFDKQGKPLLSWRVHLLPFMEQKALYEQFNLDEPWDSEHNKKLIKKMPKVYSSASGELVEEGRTRFVVPAGPGTAFAGKKGLKIAQITDGTSNTILAVEADDDRAVVWTKPEDLTIDPKNPGRGLKGTQNKGFLALFMDGSVRVLPATLNPKTLLALFTPDGGEVIQLP